MKGYLTINVDKSKVMVFSKGRQTEYSFQNNNDIEVVKEFKYLGVLFSRSGSFYTTKKHIAHQAQKAMYNLIKRARTLDLLIDLQIELFEKMVKPILLYGCEIWGFGNLDVIERVFLKYLKMILGMKQSTPNFMVYGETGTYPVSIDICCRMIIFWTKVVSSNALRLSMVMYNIVYSNYKYLNGRQACFKWMENIRNSLNMCGCSGIWVLHSFPNVKWLTKAVQQNLTDNFITKWFSDVDTSSSSLNYRLFKTKFCLEKYLVTQKDSASDENQKSSSSYRKWEMESNSKR